MEMGQVWGVEKWVSGELCVEGVDFLSVLQFCLKSSQVLARCGSVQDAVYSVDFA